MRTKPTGLVRRKKVGDYIVSSVIKQGTMCQVRTAVHMLVDERVAVKIASKSSVHRDRAVEKRLQNEAAALRRLQHPSIVTLYDVMETENSYYLVEEIATGVSLKTQLKQHRILPETDVRECMRQLISAVDHMHRVGIVHRDLRLENIIVNKNGLLKIIDFGSSHSDDGRCCVYERLGPLDYHAPEIVYKEIYNHDVDIWTIGVDLYQLVSGRLPYAFDEDICLDKYQRTVERGASLPNHVSQGCRDLVVRLLDPNPRSRISMAQIYVQPWINDGHRSAPARVLPQATETQLNPSVVQYMTDVLCADKNEIRTSVSQRKVNGISAIYHLLRKRLNRGEGLPDPDNLNKNIIQRDTKIRWTNEPDIISARDLYESVDYHYLKETSISSKTEIREIDTVRDQNYKECLQRLRVKSSKPGTAKTETRTEKSSPSVSRLDSATWLRPDVTPSPTRTPLLATPRSGRQNGRLRMSATRQVVAKVGDSHSLQQTLNSSKMSPLDSLQDGILSVKLFPMSVHKREALRRIRDESQSNHRLPPPPPNSAMGRRTPSQQTNNYNKRTIPVSSSLPRFRKYYHNGVSNGLTASYVRESQQVKDTGTGCSVWMPVVPRRAWEASPSHGCRFITIPTASSDEGHS